MSILKSLADDWHRSNPYHKLILSAAPETKHVEQIEKLLFAIYEAEHYGFKKYATSAVYTIYDMDIDMWKAKISRLHVETKKEEETLEKLTKKFAELEGFIRPEDVEEEEDDEEAEETPAPKEQGKQHVIATAKSTKSAQLAAKEEAKKKAHLAKVTKSNMATAQQKLIDMQKEVLQLEKRVAYYGHYQYADIGHQQTFRRLALAYEKDQDVKKLIQGISDMLDYYHMIRRRYIPEGPCAGSPKGLCETHCLPLYATSYTKDGHVATSECSLHPL